MLSCKDAIRLASEQLDRDLPLWRRFWLRLHVLMCRACSRYTGQVKAIDKAILEHCRGDLLVQRPERLPDEALDRIKASLRSPKPDSDSERTV